MPLNFEDKIRELHQYGNITPFQKIVKGKEKYPWPKIKWSKTKKQDINKVLKFFADNPSAAVTAIVNHELYFVLDIDCKNGKDGFKSIEDATGINLRKYRDTYVVSTISGGMHFWWKVPEGYTFHLKGGLCDVGGLEGVDTRCKGNLTVTAPTPGYEALTDMPTMSFCPKEILDLLEPKDKKKEVAPKRILRINKKQMATYLKLVDPTEFHDRNSWLRIMMAVKSGCGGEPWGKELFIKWSLRDESPWKTDVTSYVDKHWETLKADTSKGVTVRTLINFARQAEIGSDEFLPVEDTTVWDFNKSGDLIGSMDNVVNLLTVDRLPIEFEEAVNSLKGLVRYNELKDAMVVYKRPPWRTLEKNYHNEDIRKSDVLEMSLLLKRIYRMNTKGMKGIVEDAMITAAERMPFNPVVNYLDKLEWDGVDRIERMLIDHCGAEDSSYTRSVIRSFMISAIARAYEPGCKADHVLILEGAQGIGKSTLINILGGEFYGAPEFPLGDKDAEQNLQGIWIVEWCEFAKRGAKETDILKAFVTKEKNRFRGSFGHGTKDWPRRCVFIITTNEQDTEYLLDQTGGRRFWPVEIFRVDREWFRENRDQLWAEAKFLYELGMQWYLTPEESKGARIEQAKRQVGDDWEGIIIEYLSKGKGAKDFHFVPADIAMNVLGYEIKDLKDPAITRKIAGVLRKLGFKRSKAKVGGPNTYKRPTKSN